MEQRSTGRIKKYGVCLNDKCGMYKQVQEIVHGDMECPECKKKLSPCAPPKKKSKNNKPIVFGAAAAAVIAAIAGGIIAFSGGSEEPVVDVVDTPEVVAQPQPDVEAKADTVVKVDTVVVRDTIVQNNTVTTNEKVTTKTVVTTTTPTQTKSDNSGSGTLRLSYGTYTGATKGGYPHGQGKLTYSTSRQINRNDAKARTTEPGDYVIGEFFNGYVVYGKHYDSAGNLKGSLNFGVGSESSYESK